MVTISPLIVHKGFIKCFKSMIGLLADLIRNFLFKQQQSKNKTFDENNLRV